MNPPAATFESELTEALRGEVLTGDVGRGMYASDASHYQIMPRAVVTPLDEADCIEAIRIAARHGVAVTPRGGGTSLSGQATGPGLVIDTSRHLNDIISIDPDTKTAVVQPGVVRDQLNAAAVEHGLHFAPDPATTASATLGGMIANNSSGTRSIVYGKTIDHVVACRVALADASVIELDANRWSERAALGGRAGEIHRAVDAIATEHRDEIIARYPRVMRRVAGYNLDAFVDGAGYTGPIGQRPVGNLTDLIVGSEGTLAFLLEATVRLTPLPKATALCVAHFDDAIESLRHIPAINAHDPSAVELLDRVVLDEGRTNAATKALAGFIEGEPDAVLIIEVFGEDDTEAAERANAIARALKEAGVGYAHPVITDTAGQSRVWELRRLGLGLISNVPGPIKGQAFVEDACVPVEHLGDYIAKLVTLCESLGVRYSMYAHASVGVIHFRPMLDLHRTDHRKLMKTIAERAFECVLEYGGVFSGEHGDGIVRGGFIERQFGPSLYKAFGQIKAVFDPDNRMNPGKVIATPDMTDPDLLRYGSHYRVAEVNAAFRYEGQDGFVGALEQCNGVGACRKTGAGTMCPSYRATRDEAHSTRGRANALRLAMSGQLGDGALASDDLHAALDLCLSCKACKTECPNAVDMSKLKADALRVRHDSRGVSLGDRFVASMPRVARRVSGLLAPVSNAMQSFGPTGALLRKTFGVDPRRPLPPMSRRPIKYRATPDVSPDDADVFLFLDTHARYFEPQIARAAVDLLVGCGLRVATEHVGCCQRPAISRGLLHDARQRAEPMMAKLDAYASRGVPIVCLEPSCASAIGDDLPDLIGDREAGQRIAEHTQLFDRFIVDRALSLTTQASDIVMHGHCHQKALYTTDASRAIFESIPDVDFKEIPAGCCGMAGSFGYTHHDLSVAIGEDRLLPAVREATAAGKTIVAAGVSCRHQLRDLLGAEVRHPVEILTVASSD